MRQLGVHPDAPAGGGGPGFFHVHKAPGPIGGVTCQTLPPVAVGVGEDIEQRFLDSAARRDWAGVRKTLLAIAERLDVRTDPGTVVLYSGGLGKMASAWADDKGKKTIDLTSPGKTLVVLTDLVKKRFRWVEDIRPAWAHLSEKFAAQAQGEVHAFVRGRRSAKGLELGKVQRPKSKGEPVLDEVKKPERKDDLGERRSVVRGAHSVFWEIEVEEIAGWERLKLKSLPELWLHVCDESQPPQELAFIRFRDWRGW